jgi:monofunctional biosynthetic peptidoglycan transglycosylase
MWLFRLAVIAVLADVFYLTTLWPDWDKIAEGPIPRSNFIERYEAEAEADPSAPRLRWYPVPLRWIPHHVRRAVIVAEDARFYEHNGIDLTAMKEAMDYNLEQGEIRYGASTISQQTVKNLFLSASRDPLRKWHELVLTLGMEAKLKKSRILAIYLNDAEFGPGIYGVEAAARHYWGMSVRNLNQAQAVELAATLPSPRKDNPATRSRSFLHRLAKIRGWLEY